MVSSFGSGLHGRGQDRGRRAEHRKKRERGQCGSAEGEPDRCAPAQFVAASTQQGSNAGDDEQHFEAGADAVTQLVRGRAAKGQLTVFGSEPGESDYNPLWEEIWVTWKKGVKPVLLGRDDQIKGLAKKGKLTMKDAHIVLNAPILKVGKGG